jgi:hypothetical protein
MDKLPVKEDFQSWLKNQGYTREYETWGAWLKDNEVVNGMEIYNKFEEYKKTLNK